MSAQIFCGEHTIAIVKLTMESLLTLRPRLHGDALTKTGESMRIHHSVFIVFTRQRFQRFCQ